MKPEDFFAAEDTRCRTEYEAGSIGALAYAFNLFSENDLPLPGWVRDGVRAKLAFLRATGKGGRRGRGQGYDPKTRHIHELRWSWMQIHLLQRDECGQRISKAAAARLTSARLIGDAAWGNERQILASFDRTQRERDAK